MDKPAVTEQEPEIIIVRLLGGLGNQMFQYALGRQLSIIHKRPLKFDPGIYSLNTKKWAARSFGLGHFKLHAQMTEAAELAPFKKYLGQNFFSKLLRRLSAYGNYYSRSYIFEPLGKNFVFDPRLLQSPLKPVVYLDGFWQTEKYFLGIENIIREDFSFKEPADAVNQPILNQIGQENSVALHIRHGDNATQLAAGHGVLPLDYYYRSAKDLAAAISNPKFYIFSDDPNWAKENLRLDFHCVFVSHNGDEKNYEDLRLMAACKHQIIGNSTFSWWGAWLGKKEGQLVYAPKKYHMNANIAIADLYPKHWKLMEIKNLS